MLSNLAFALDRSAIFRVAVGEPDKWQSDVLQSDDSRLLLNCCRQSGKSSTAAVLALHTALFSPGSLTLLLSPSERQSAEIFRKAVDAYRAAGKPVRTKNESALKLELENQSRILALPSTEETLRGFSNVNLLVIDEAARVGDESYYGVRPFLAVSGGRLVAMSTPKGRRGWFYNGWANESGWRKIKVPASECSRISEAFLEQERESLGAFFFRQEFGCEFLDVNFEGFILGEDIEQCIKEDIEQHQSAPIDFGVDVARSAKGDRTALVIVQSNSVLEIETGHYPDTMQTVGIVMQFAERYRPHSIRIDDGGVGGGVTDRLYELQAEPGAPRFLRELEIIPFMFGSKAFDPERFSDVRTEMWWHCGELIHQGKLRFPRNPQLCEELTRPSMGQDSRGRLKLESKAELRRRGLKSPDIADALCLAVYPDDWLGGSGGW